MRVRQEVDEFIYMIILITCSQILHPERHGHINVTTRLQSIGTKVDNGTRLICKRHDLPSQFEEMSTWIHMNSISSQRWVANRTKIWQVSSFLTTFTSNRITKPPVGYSLPNLYGSRSPEPSQSTVIIQLKVTSDDCEPHHTIVSSIWS